MAQRVTGQLLILASDSDEPIKLIINSPGGHVESGDTIFDMIRFVQAPVKVIGTGWVASAGALIYAAAEKEKIGIRNKRRTFAANRQIGRTKVRNSSDADSLSDYRRFTNLHGKTHLSAPESPSLWIMIYRLAM